MNDPNWFWMAALLGVVIYCVVQTVRDVRAKHYGWAAAAAISALVLATMPIQTHAVEVDLPVTR